MAENKKSFVAYCDWQETFEELSDEEAGKLVKHLFNYVNDKNPETSDKLTKMCFIPIKQSLKRDLKKYETYKEKQSVNGKKGGRPKNPTLSQKTQPFIKKPKKADSVSVSDNVSDTPIYVETPLQPNTVTEEIFLKRWCDARTHYDKVPTFIKKLTTFERIDFNDLKQDYKLKDFERAMTGMFQQKTYPKTRLRPTHFLKRENFEPYLTCFTTKEKLFDDNKYKKKIDRI
tara:strand:- start:1912 stop:2601 length:690 start_codon:yes stop_codon:yes gene_type:complete